MKNRIIIVSFLLTLAISFQAFASDPTDVIKVKIDQIFGLLQDSKYKQPGQLVEQREKIWKLINEAFDFNEMSKRSVGRYWKKFTAPEREAFADLFSRLLGNIYIDRIQKGFTDEKVEFLSVDRFSDTKAVVKTKILRASMEIPILYSMLNKSGNWRVYDVNIEGVSLIKNYRAQFSKILIKDKPSELISLLKKKVERQEKNRAINNNAAGIEGLLADRQHIVCQPGRCFSKIYA